MLFLNNDDQSKAIEPTEALQALRDALAMFDEGNAVRRPRIDSIIPTSRQGAFFIFSSMEGGIRDGYYALRIKPDIYEFPEVGGVPRLRSYNKSPGRYGGLVFLFDAETAEFVAMMNDGFVQHLRVATSAALGVEHLARRESSVLGIVGSGGMARFFPLTVNVVRPLQKIVAYSPNSANLRAYCSEMTESMKIPVEAVSSAEEVCAESDILCTCTTSLEPVVLGKWIRPGTHINNVTPWEMSEDACAAVDVVGLHVDRPPLSVGGLVDEGFDIRFAVMSWAAGNQQELAAIPEGKPPAVRYPNARVVRTCDWRTGVGYQRENADDITILGNHSYGTLEGDSGISSGIQGLQFAAVAGKIYQNARQRRIGSDLPNEIFVQSIPT